MQSTANNVKRSDAQLPPPDSFAWIGDYTEEHWHPSFRHYHSAKELIASEHAPELIVFSLDSEEQDIQLNELRKCSVTALSKIFVEHESTLSPFLSNGVWNEDCLDAFEHYRIRTAKVNLTYDDDPKFKLLTYLWLHDELLTPRMQPSKSYLFSYPLLSAFGIELGETERWLAALVENDWINKDTLTNRVRYCASCQSGHLNYVDVCPKCESIDTKVQSSLHCFNCGHVGNQEAFKTRSSLTCPNCLTKLRHIGTDYDRPIETSKCQSCEHLFSESLVVAECLHCHVHNPLDKLQIRNVYHYSLSVFGGALVRRGMSHFTLMPSVGDQMSYSQFYWLLEWLNKLAKRHNMHHTVISLQALNLAEFLKDKGEVEGMIRLDAIQERLKSVTRMTDACCNDSEGGLLMLFPVTELKQLSAVIKKLENVKSQQHDQLLQLELKVLELPDDIGSNVEEWLIDRLNQVKANVL
ncbi:hypothetical protein CWI78_04130 [Idiomarina ramblicola]|uniref:Thaumarchaeal output domain-containing protein n=1 Tax=Idiomarina ramblicola TaxID=263724 RepID=A0A432Z256_9GAMM|nr:hypothetical protein CWI78_04130 [Idiomarina ramblicola]